MSSSTKKAINVLIVLEQDIRTTRADVPSQLQLLRARDYEEAEKILNEGLAEVVVSRYQVDEHHSWRDLLQKRSPEKPTPLAIVVDRNADEAMWGEVLEHGAFDLLREPLHPEELHRALAAACTTLVEPELVPTRRASPNNEKKQAAAA